MKPLNAEIAKIKQDLKSKKITQAALSKRTGIAIQTIKKIFTGETANPRIDTLAAIKKAVYGDNAEPEFSFPVSDDYILTQLKNQGFVEKNEFDNLTEKQKRLIADIVKDVIKHSE